MGLRIAVGGFMHETNTFVAKPTAWDDFVNAGPWPGATEGEAILTTFRGINLAIAYFMEEAEKAGHAMLPLAWGGAMPAGKPGIYPIQVPAVRRTPTCQGGSGREGSGRRRTRFRDRGCPDPTQSSARRCPRARFSAEMPYAAPENAAQEQAYAGA
jgi:hypothetical protein